jgi:hypothetical protein
LVALKSALIALKSGFDRFEVGLRSLGSRASIALNPLSTTFIFFPSSRWPLTAGPNPSRPAKQRAQPFLVRPGLEEPVRGVPPPGHPSAASDLQFLAA